MSKRLPPLNLLRAFEAAARHRSYSTAASELHVTHGAVSRQITRLEAHVGIKLFVRRSKGVELSPDGITYYKAVDDALNKIAAATDRLAQVQRDEIRVNAPPTFAMKWLVPKLSHFYASNEDVEISLRTEQDAWQLALRNADVVIRRGPDVWEGHHRTLFLDEFISPIAHTSLIPRPAKSATELHDYVWLAVDARPTDWKMWLEAAGEPELMGKRLLRFDHSSLALEAVRDGTGIAMAPLSVVGAELKRHSAILVFPQVVAQTPGYYAICHPTKNAVPMIQRFIDWLKVEGRKTPLPNQSG